jgi:hypothetical protein
LLLEFLNSTLIVLHSLQEQPILIAFILKVEFGISKTVELSVQLVDLFFQPIVNLLVILLQSFH